jgi:hypothetical protein
LRRGLDATAACWPDLRLAYSWVHQAAHILVNAEEQDGPAVRAAFQQLVETMRTEQARAGTLSPAITHFLKVTASYGERIFHCYAVPDLPATNNELERCFGSVRYHERRATGRRTITGGLVVRGSVRLVTVLATPHQGFSASDLQVRDPAAWQDLRQRLEKRHETRRAQRRFRKDPAAYLALLEQHLLK